MSHTTPGTLGRSLSLAALGLALAGVFALTLASTPASAQLNMYSYNSEIPHESPPMTCPPVMPPIQPPVVTQPPRPPIMPPVMQPPTTMPPIMTATDCTSAPMPESCSNVTGDALSQGLVPSTFPGENEFDGAGDFILVRESADAKLERLNQYSVKVESGDVVGSVRRPSKMGLMKLANAEVAVYAGGDALVQVDAAKNVTRIICLSGCHGKIRVKLASDITGLAKDGEQSYNLSPGFELVCAKGKLCSSEVRPCDGYARRRTQVLGEGNIALSEVNTESVLNSSPLIASMIANHNDKELRVLKDLSKMAAVLNAVNGTQGYTVQGQTGLAQAEPGSPAADTAASVKAAQVQAAEAAAAAAKKADTGEDKPDVSAHEHTTGQAYTAQ